MTARAASCFAWRSASSPDARFSCRNNLSFSSTTSASNCSSSTYKLATDTNAWQRAVEVWCCRLRFASEAASCMTSRNFCNFSIRSGTLRSFVCPKFRADFSPDLEALPAKMEASALTLAFPSSLCSWKACFVPSNTPAISLHTFSKIGLVMIALFASEASLFDSPSPPFTRSSSSFSPSASKDSSASVARRVSSPSCPFGSWMSWSLSFLSFSSISSTGSRRRGFRAGFARG